MPEIRENPSIRKTPAQAGFRRKHSTCHCSFAIRSSTTTPRRAKPLPVILRVAKPLSVILRGAKPLSVILRGAKPLSVILRVAKPLHVILRVAKPLSVILRVAKPLHVILRVAKPLSVILRVAKRSRRISSGICLIVHAFPGATLSTSINPSLDILSSRSALKKLRFLSATPTGPHPVILRGAKPLSVILRGAKPLHVILRVAKRSRRISSGILLHYAFHPCFRGSTGDSATSRRMTCTPFHPAVTCTPFHPAVTRTPFHPAVTRTPFHPPPSDARRISSQAPMASHE